MEWLDQVKWDRDGLVPAIAQEAGSNDVLMCAFMNRAALRNFASPPATTPNTLPLWTDDYASMFRILQ